jgi:hypothetical protein
VVTTPVSEMLSVDQVGCILFKFAGRSEEQRWIDSLDGWSW